MEIKAMIKNFRGEVKGVSPGCVHLSSPNSDIGIERRLLVQKSSVRVTSSWLKWEQNQLQSSRNPHREKSDLLVDKCTTCWEVKKTFWDK